MKNNDRTTADLKAEENADQAEIAARERWLNLGVAVLATWLVIMATDISIAPYIDLSKSFGKYLVGSVALQLAPTFFGWIARKIRFTSGKWIGVYWLTLFLILILRAVFLANATAPYR